MPRYYELTADEFNLVKAYRQGNQDILALALSKTALKAPQTQDYTWVDTLVITEELAGKDKNTIFYIREKPFKSGYSYQSTASTKEAAEWVIEQLRLNVAVLTAKTWLSNKSD